MGRFKKCVFKSYGKTVDVNTCKQINDGVNAKTFVRANASGAYGGGLSYGKRKGSRPLSTKNSHHVVLRADQGTASFLRKERRDFILSAIKRWAKHFGVKVYAQSINSNHIHLILYGKSVSALHGFLRVCPGQIAQKLGKEKIRFWKHLAFSRIITWGRAFHSALRYVEQNTFEAAGLIPYAPRKSRYGPRCRM